MGKIKKVYKTDFNITGMDMWRDITLARSERGLLGTMLSLPDNWDFSIKGLTAILPDGQDAIRASLRKLEELGYLKRTKIINEKGIILDWEYHFSDSACFKSEGELLKIERKRKKEEKLRLKLVESPVVENPQLDNPQLDNPLVENPTQLSIKELSIKESSINQSIIPSGSSMSIKGLDKLQNDLIEGTIEDNSDYTALIYENIDYEIMKQRMLSDRLLRLKLDEFEEIVSILVDVVNNPRKTIRVDGTNFSWQTVQSAFLKLDYSHIEFVMDCLEQNTTKITNIKAYITSCLYNSPQTINNYYRSKINHDMPWLAKKEDTL